MPTFLFPVTQQEFFDVVGVPPKEHFEAQPGITKVLVGDYITGPDVAPNYYLTEPPQGFRVSRIWRGGVRLMQVNLESHHFHLTADFRFYTLEPHGYGQGVSLRDTQGRNVCYNLEGCASVLTGVFALAFERGVESTAFLDQIPMARPGWAIPIGNLPAYDPALAVQVGLSLRSFDLETKENQILEFLRFILVCHYVLGSFPTPHPALGGGEVGMSRRTELEQLVRRLLPEWMRAIAMLDLKHPDDESHPLVRNEALVPLGAMLSWFSRKQSRGGG